MKRFRPNKAKSVKKFRKNAGRTKAVNLAPPRYRGGNRF